MPEIRTAIQSSEVTQENLGDLLLYSYAAFLRQYDDLQKRQAEFRETGQQLERSGARHFTQFHFFDAIQNMAADEVGELTMTETEKEALARSHMMLGVSAILATRLASLRLNGERAAEKQWPRKHQARVTDISEDGGIIRPLGLAGGKDAVYVYARGKSPVAVKGKLESLVFEPSTSGILYLRRRHRLIGTQLCEIGPIINREDYTANVRLSILG